MKQVLPALNVNFADTIFTDFCNTLHREMPSTSVSQEQLEEFREAFSLFDKNNDGTVARNVLHTVCHALGIHVTQQQIEDFNFGEQVTFNDFLEFATALLQQDNDDDNNPDIEKRIASMKKAFDVFDNDKTGLIPIDEFMQAMTTLGNAPLNEQEMEGIQQFHGITIFSQNLNKMPMKMDLWILIFMCAKRNNTLKCTSKLRKTMILMLPCWHFLTCLTRITMAKLIPLSFAAFCVV